MSIESKKCETFKMNYSANRADRMFMFIKSG